MIPIISHLFIDDRTVERLNQQQDGLSLYQRRYRAAFDEIDAASVLFFRIAFGAMMASWAWDYLVKGRVTELYITPKFHFSYTGFEWIQPWPGNGMYYHFLVLLVLAIAICCGFFYRLTSLLFAVGFTLFFLMERTNYQNHYYLIALIAWSLPLLPLNRLVSCDAYLKQRRTGRKPEDRVPRWALWCLQFHLALPYIFGGLAKLTPDWLVGQPMGLFLAAKSDVPVVGPWLNAPSAGLLMSWGGLIFDLVIVPALLWKPTRGIAYVASLGFHLINACLFNIHVFPWFMIVATTIFFDPSWPRRLLGAPAIEEVNATPAVLKSKTRLWAARIALVYIVFHLIWPLRCWLYPGDPSWHEQGHLFSWRMMLRVKEVGLGYALEDPQTGLVANVNHKQFLAIEQSDRFSRDPRLIVQFARFLAEHFEKELGRKPIVHSVALASLNGRKPQLLVDPNKDLASVDIRQPSEYIMPLKEELRFPLWTVPVEQWVEKVTLPPIDFLERMKKRQESKARPNP